MEEKTAAWETLQGVGFLHAVREAHREATLAVFQSLDREAGFAERTFGVASFEALTHQLDQVFEDEPRVKRDDLNGSPGWRYRNYRILLKRHRMGHVRHIRWDRDSFTKQQVARQEYADDRQLALDLGLERVRDTPGDVTLVLAHSATDEPLEMELFLGRPRWNDDGGDAWHWIKPVDDDIGADPRRKLVERTLPLWGDEEADVPLRLRGRRTSTETA